MRILKRPPFGPRKIPVRHGAGNHGKRRLVGAVMMRTGLTVLEAQKAVDGVINAWKLALIAGEQVELPIGVLKVVKTRKDVYKKRITRVPFGKLRDDGVRSWTIHNDRYRIIWRAPNEEWEQLCADIITPEEKERLRQEALLDEEMTQLFRELYDVPSAELREELVRVAGSKQILLRCLHYFKRNKRRFPLGFPLSILSSVAHIARHIREALPYEQAAAGPVADADGPTQLGRTGAEIGEVPPHGFDSKARKKKESVTNKERQRLLERARQRVALGRCVLCGRGPLVTKTHCASCRELVRAASQRRRERLKSSGTCIECGHAPAAAGVQRCPRCTARAILRTRRAEARRKAALEAVRGRKNPEQGG